MLIDASASALNNAGAEEGARTDNTVAVKRIRTRNGDYPYVSAQSVRYWLRTYLERSCPKWRVSPTRREAKVAYTDGNPIAHWDDDLFGYMRAESKRAGARGENREDDLTPTSREITRISPLRVGTFVSMAPVRIVDDFGTMARHDGDPVPHEHQFYRATLKGMFSLNLSTAGTFFDGGRVGYRNLEDNRVRLARENNLEEIELHGQPAFRLPVDQRAERVATLVRALGELEGGAKLALHYTDVTPPLVLAAVIKGGNNPLSRALGVNSQGDPEFNTEAFAEALRVYNDQLLSDVFVGWARGYLDGERAKLVAMTDEERSGVRLRWGHPREAMAEMAAELAHESRHSWYD
jgi:CRISPR-associated protein Cst2